MPAQTCTNRQFNAPVDAVGVEVTPNAGAWVYSNWYPLIAAADADLALTSVIPVTVGAAATFEVQIGVSISGGATTAIATKKGVFGSTSAAGGPPMRWIYPIANIPSGAAVNVRMRKSGTSVVAWRWAIQYLKLPIGGTLDTTAVASEVTTPGAALTTLNTSTTAWAWGTWTTILDPCPANLLITSFIVPGPFNGADYELQVGRGAAGAESILETVKIRCGAVGSASGGPSVLELSNPLAGVLSGDRAAMRWRKAGTAATQLTTGFEYYRLPL